MTYSAFQSAQKEYLEKVTPQGTKNSIRHIPEIHYGDNYTVRLLDSDGIQERLDILRAEAEIKGGSYDENREKGKLIRQLTGDLTQEARLEYEKFIPAKDPEKLYQNLQSFYAQMTGGKKLTEEFNLPEAQEQIKKLMGKEDLTGVTDVEKAAALTAVRKSYVMLEMQNLRNTNTAAGYHIITVENKAANPLGFHMSRIVSLPEETQAKLKPFADKLLPVTHDGGAWHEMVHALGTDDESKCEGFRFLKTLKEYQEPVLVYPDINARLYNNLSTLEKIRKDAREGKRTMDGNFRYIMPKMMRRIMENAEGMTAEMKGMTDAGVMEKNKQIVKECAYDEKTENAFRALAKTCETPDDLAAKLQAVYKNGSENPETAAVFPLVDDFVRTAHFLNPSVPLEEVPQRFFAPENFKSESRNAGKINIEKEEHPELSAAEKKQCQKIYRNVRRENPKAKGKEFDRLFAVAVVKDAWHQKAAFEADLENPEKAKNILFNKEKCAEHTAQVNACLRRSKNAAAIVKVYGAEFEKGRVSLHSVLSEIQKKQDAAKTSPAKQKDIPTAVRAHSVQKKQR